MPMGSQKFAILLCKFSDSAETEPQPVGFFEDLFINRGTGGLNDYWTDASLGAINLDGSRVFGWHTIDQKRDDYIAARPDRWSKIKGAIDAFDLQLDDYAGFVALFNIGVGDSSASGKGVLGGPSEYNVTFLAHETGHVLGLDHSYDQSTRKTNTWSAPGEYWDEYDIMSAMNVFSHWHQRFGQRGPLLCAPNLNRMSWLPRNRVWTSPHPGSFSECLELVPLGHPELPGYLAAEIGPYTIEMRVPDRWDAGLSQACVLIHRMSGDNAMVLASDKENWVNEWQAGQTFGPNQVEMVIAGGTRIQVAALDAANMKARICVNHQVGRDDKEGVLILGSVAVGDGWVLLKDVLYRIPPKGDPLRDMLGSLAHAGLQRRDVAMPQLSASDIETIAVLKSVSKG